MGFGMRPPTSLSNPLRLENGLHTKRTAQSISWIQKPIFIKAHKRKSKVSDKEENTIGGSFDNVAER